MISQETVNRVLEKHPQLPKIIFKGIIDDFVTIKVKDKKIIRIKYPKENIDILNKYGIDSEYELIYAMIYCEFPEIMELKNEG